MAQKNKQSFYIPDDAIAEIRAEAKRLDRSASWIMQRAWIIAREKIRAMSSVEPSEEVSS